MIVDVPAPEPERPAVHVHAHAAQPAAARTAPVVQTANVAPTANAPTVEQTLRVPVETPVPVLERGASVDHLARVRAVDPLSRVRVAIVVSVEQSANVDLVASVDYNCKVANFTPKLCYFTYTENMLLIVVSVHELFYFYMYLYYNRTPMCTGFATWKCTQFFISIISTTII